MQQKLNIDRVAFDAFIKRRYIYVPSYDVYQGVKGLYDFGPIGCMLKNNLISLWKQHFFSEPDIFEIETPAITPSVVLEASGHTAKFDDLMVRDMITSECFRADHLIKAVLTKMREEKPDEFEVTQDLACIDDCTASDLAALLKKYQVKSPETGNDISEPFPFNLMFQTFIGPTGTIKGYLRPEIAQGIFTNFNALLDWNGGKIPFGAGQVGSAYRNEISPRSGLIRMREFTLCEFEYFVDPQDKRHKKFSLFQDIILPMFPKVNQKTDGTLVYMFIKDAVAQGIINSETLAYFMARSYQFLISVGIPVSSIRFREHLDNERAHYASCCWDAELLTSYGWIEVAGHADRGCYDLTNHSNKSGCKMTVYEQFPEPVVEKITRIKPNKALIGKTFKDDAGSIIKTLEDFSVTQITLPMNILVNDCTFTLTEDMYTIITEEKKVNGRNYIPAVIEPSFGIGRILYALLENSFVIREAEEENETTKGVVQRTYLKLDPMVAPIKCAVLPLTGANELVPYVTGIRSLLEEAHLSYKVDDTGTAIGRRYSRMDEIGVPFAITIDFQTVKDNTVTLRERDSCEQIRLEIGNDLVEVLKDLIDGSVGWTLALSNL